MRQSPDRCLPTQPTVLPTKLSPTVLSQTQTSHRWRTKSILHRNGLAIYPALAMGTRLATNAAYLQRQFMICKIRLSNNSVRGHQNTQARDKRSARPHYTTVCTYTTSLHTTPNTTATETTHAVYTTAHVGKIYQSSCPVPSRPVQPAPPRHSPPPARQMPAMQCNADRPPFIQP